MFFPRRQWTSTLRAYPGRGAAGDPDGAPTGIPYAASLLTGFFYSPSALSLSVGVPMALLAPTVLPAGATALVFQITPNPPPGLVWDNRTGQLTGTPTTPQALTNYTVAVTAGNNMQTTFSITVT